MAERPAFGHPAQVCAKRSVQKKGKGNECITRVIYEKRRNPEDRENWWRDAAQELGKSLIIGGLPAAALLYGLHKWGKADLGASVGLPGGMRVQANVPRKAVDVTDDVADAVDTPPTPKRSRRPKATAPETKAAVGETLTTQTGRPPAAPRAPISQSTLDEATKAGILKAPKSSVRQAKTDLDSFLTGLRRSQPGAWTVEGNITRPRGAAGYQATVLDPQGQPHQLRRIWDGQTWHWRRIQAS